MREIKINETTIWQETGQLKFYKNGVAKIYKQLVKGELGGTYVEGQIFNAHSFSDGLKTIFDIVVMGTKELHDALNDLP